MSHDTFEVILEKKGRGKGFSFSRPWTIRTFKLKGQQLEYWDKDLLKGTIEIKGSATGIVPSSEADGREFGFAINTSTEKLILNASSSVLREQCIERFNTAANDPDWAKRRTAEQKAYEKAATSAVAGAFAEEAEKARLRAEMEALENQRKQEASAAAANVMAEGLANKALEDARRAEAEQNAQQQAEIASLMGQSNAKKRFREAIAKGLTHVARGAAASMLQSAWRGKLAARKVAQKKAEKIRLLKDGYARKIQARYRVRLAKRKIERIKAEKFEIKKKLCAIKVQGRWRMYLAKKAYKKKQEAKLREHYSKSVGRTRGLIKLQNVIRAFIAKRRVAKIRVALPTVVQATVLKVEGVSANEADVGAIYSAVILDVALDHPFLYRGLEVPEEIIRTASRVTSNHRADSIQARQPGLITSPRRMDFAVVTLFDRSHPAKDDFLGQVCVRLSDLQRNYSGSGNHTVELTLPLTSKLNVHIPDEKGGQQITVRKAGSGIVTVAFTLLDPAFSICGPIFKVSESMLSNAWKKRWFVLSNGLLQYFNSEFALENSKNTIILKDVTSLKLETYKGREGVKISFLVEGKETFWMIDFDENTAPMVKRMWMRRLYLNSPAVPDPAMERFTAKLAKLNIVASSSNAAATEGAISPINNKTKTPISKRMSIFK